MRRFKEGFVGLAIAGLVALSPAAASAAASWSLNGLLNLGLGYKQVGGDDFAQGASTGRGNVTFSYTTGALTQTGVPTSSASFTDIGHSFLGQVNINSTPKQVFIGGYEVEFEGVATDGGWIEAEVDPFLNPVTVRMNVNNTGTSAMMLDWLVFPNVMLDAQADAGEFAQVEAGFVVAGGPGSGVPFDIYSQAQSSDGSSGSIPELLYFTTNVAAGTSAYVDILFGAFAYAESLESNVVGDVPVPAALPLLASAVAGFAFLRRRRRA